MLIIKVFKIQYFFLNFETCYLRMKLSHTIFPSPYNHSEMKLIKYTVHIIILLSLFVDMLNVSQVILTWYALKIVLHTILSTLKTWFRMKHLNSPYPVWESRPSICKLPSLQFYVRQSISYSTFESQYLKRLISSLKK